MNLNQLTLPSRDLLRAIPFYELLGLELIVDSRPRYARFVCPDGQSTLSLHHVEELPVGEGIVIYFECENLQEEYDRLKEAGLDFSQAPRDERWLWREARLEDPDGNRICLYYAGENRVNPPWRINRKA